MSFVSGRCGSADAPTRHIIGRWACRSVRNKTFHPNSSTIDTIIPQQKIMDMKLQRIIITWTLVLISTVVTLAQTTGLYTYEGGYFIKNGNSWEEYRPDFQEGVWAAYEQYNEEENFYNIQNSQCVVSVPKSTVNKFYYAKPGEEWQPIYNTKEIYEYMPDSGREISRRLLCP